ncbi:MAG: OmpA family protein [Candidatus Eisenbacteria bacterium]|uniref:OmpA family protein n=1 Tax=Eiseniibacteriota bacterium TaxID=2212470 RepID=A0A933SD38_UNCEI|nr:OmpA family protein [Candidatus Eisenbacteria bacterium]
MPASSPLRSTSPFTTRLASLALALLLAVSAAVTAVAPVRAATPSDRTKYDSLIQLMDTSKASEVHVFAPKAWERATDVLVTAKAVLDQGGRQNDADRMVAEAREYVENAIKAAEVCKLSLKEHLEPRRKAQAAKAPTLVPEMWKAAEDKFLEATAKVESGDVKGGIKKAAEAAPLFDVAEDGAIRVTVMGTADKLIATALADEAQQYAPSTLDAARAARKAAADLLTKDRYNRTTAVQQAARAEYEARHASNIAMSVRSLNRNDQAWEKLMLLYEIQMNRIGKAMGWETLPFDNGPIAAADSVLAGVARLQGEHVRLQGESSQARGEAARTQGERDAATATLRADMDKMRDDFGRGLQGVLGRLSVTSTQTDPGALLQQLDQRATELLAERATLDERLKAADARIAELSASQQQTSAELQARQAKDERLTKARTMLNPSEGEVLVNSTGDVVLRLSGLSFDAGKADLKDAHMPLLGKVQEILKLFPNSSVVVEGHTDMTGDGTANQQLSDKRAFAVMQYLRQALAIPADHIRSIGYGAEKPIAPNNTPAGKAKNRRIDILILQ